MHTRCATCRLADFYRNVVVSVPFVGTAIGLLTIVSLLFLEQRKWRSPTADSAHVQVGAGVNQSLAKLINTFVGVVRVWLTIYFVYCMCICNDHIVHYNFMITVNAIYKWCLTFL